MTGYGWLAAAIASICIYIFAWIAKRKHQHGYFSRQGIAGPKPDLLLGNRSQLRQDPINALTKWMEEFGPHFGIFEGAEPIIVCSDLDVIRQILIKDHRDFMDRPDATLDVEPFSSSILFLKGDRWKRVRSVITPAFSAAKMRLMAGTMRDCVATFVDLVCEHARAEGGNGRTFDMAHLAQGLTLDVIAKCALALDTDCQRGESALRKQVTAFFAEANNAVVEWAVALSTLRPLLKFAYQLGSPGGLIATVMANLKRVIALRRAGSLPKQPDMLQLMLDAQRTAAVNDESSGGGSHKSINDTELVANVVVFLLAGFETTATALAFITQALVDHPDVQQRIFDEVRERLPQKLSSGERFEYEDVQDLPYLEQVINEALRLYPPVVLFVTRKCLRTTIINDKLFPAGCRVLVPVFQLHRDPNLWPDPEQFQPERFAVGNRAASFDGYLPFGLGPRMCIGMRFAMLELKIALAQLLCTVRLEPGDGFVSPPELIVPSVIINPKNGVLVRARLLSASAKVDA